MYHESVRQVPLACVFQTSGTGMETLFHVQYFPGSPDKILQITNILLLRTRSASAIVVGRHCVQARHKTTSACPEHLSYGDLHMGWRTRF